MHLRRDGISNTSEEFNGELVNVCVFSLNRPVVAALITARLSSFDLTGVESRGTEGESSCLLTPTSSPTHGGMSRKRPVNGEFGSDG